MEMSYDELINRIGADQQQEIGGVEVIADELLDEVSGGNIWGQATWTKSF